ncbi:MAG: M12 family metallo-peptidase, partial [Phyllobacterium sp.]
PSRTENPPRPDRPTDLGVDGEPPTAPSDPIIIGLMQRIGLVQRAEAQPVPDKILIDVMVLYTDGVLEFAGGDSEAVLGKIAKAISDANRSYRKSQVQQQLRLAHFEHTTYQETDDLHKALSALKDSSNFPALSGVMETRSNYNADIVVMLTKPVPKNGMCGHASQMTENSSSFCDRAFAVVPVNCATSTHSFAHELGHVMGADHNIMFDGNGMRIAAVRLFEHSHGFVSPTNRWRTIMAYPTSSCVLPSCKRIPYWSNPEVSYPPPRAANQVQPQTVFTGSEAENNARSLNLTRGNVASFSDACN